MTHIATTPANPLARLSFMRWLHRLFAETHVGHHIQTSKERIAQDCLEGCPGTDAAVRLHNLANGADLLR